VDKSKVPVGVVSVPVLVDDNGTTYKTTMKAGHFCFTSDNEGTIIKPSIDWLIQLDEKPAKVPGQIAGVQVKSTMTFGTSFDSVK